MSKFDFVKASSAAKTTAVQSTTKRPGRPPAKRTDPGYLQITAYIRRATHAEAKLKLLKERVKNQGEGRDFSELIEDLVTDWLKRK